MNEKAYIHTLVTAVRYDLSRGMEKEEVLKGLTNVVSRELVAKVKEQV